MAFFTIGLGLGLGGAGLVGAGGERGEHQGDGGQECECAFHAVSVL
jgi:hypothetical protein